MNENHAMTSEQQIALSEIRTLSKPLAHWARGMFAQGATVWEVLQMMRTAANALEADQIARHSRPN
jgi:uncharacterized membrane protein YjjP (DUF1212 family)